MPKCVNGGKRNITKRLIMKSLTKISNLAMLFILVASLFSCDREKLPTLPEEVSGQTILLFDQLQVNSTPDGEYTFVEDNDKVQSILEEVLIKENESFVSIDNFGFTTDDQTGTPYLFVKQRLEERVETLFMPLLKKDRNIAADSNETINNAQERRSYWVAVCVSEQCCTECIMHNGGCACYDVDNGCIGNGQSAHCTQEMIRIR